MPNNFSPQRFQTNLGRSKTSISSVQLLENHLGFWHAEKESASQVKLALSNIPSVILISTSLILIDTASIFLSPHISLIKRTEALISVFSSAVFS